MELRGGCKGGGAVEGAANAAASQVSAFSVPGCCLTGLHLLHIHQPRVMLSLALEGCQLGVVQCHCRAWGLWAWPVSVGLACVEVDELKGGHKVGSLASGRAQRRLQVRLWRHTRRFCE